MRIGKRVLKAHRCPFSPSTHRGRCSQMSSENPLADVGKEDCDQNGVLAAGEAAEIQEKSISDRDAADQRSA